MKGQRSLNRPRKGREAHLAQPIHRLLIANRVSFEVVLCERKDETRNGDDDTLQRSNELASASGERGRGRTNEVLVVENRDDTEGPVGRGDDLGMFAVETKEGESGFLLDKRFRRPAVLLKTSASLARVRVERETESNHVRRDKQPVHVRR